MYTFIGSLLILIVSYFTYAKYIERLIKPKASETPAYKNFDAIDYVPMPYWKNALIQLLNIAGVGPVFGPIMGALYGPVALLWIVFGSIFAGAVHDYLIGMISLRNNGMHLPQLSGFYLGNAAKHMINLFAVILLLLLGTVFVVSPAKLLVQTTGSFFSLDVFLGIIFLYYILATLLPIDKLIGKLYPFLAILLLLSALGIGAKIFFGEKAIPEINLENLHPEGLPLFPLLFLTISCGALSGFHATQSPIIARTLRKEKDGRFVFYGMMIAEAIIAMIWATAAMSFFEAGEILSVIKQSGPAAAVEKIATFALGAYGGTLAVLGVIILAITSGDTAFRSLRMIVADYFGIVQKAIQQRLYIVVPIFIVSYWLTKMDFSLLWRYFSLANQLTAVIALLTISRYLQNQKLNVFVSIIPATIMLQACFTYLFYERIGFGFELSNALIIAAISTIFIIIAFFHFKDKLVNDEKDPD